MDNVKFYIAPILEELCEKVFSGICKPSKTGRGGKFIPNVYAGHRPSGIEGMPEFLVVRTSANTGDHWAWQQSSVYIDIRVKNMEHGIENTKRLQELTDIVVDKFPYKSENGRFTISNPQLVIKGDDALEFTCWTVRGSLQINTIDRFNNSNY